MRTLRLRLITVVMLFLIVGGTPCLVVAADPEISPEQLAFFESKIRPVLVQECYRCHSHKTGNAKGGLRLDTELSTRQGGSSGPAIVVGDAQSSLLYNAIAYQELAMPPDRQLSQNVIDDFRKWIEMGAPDPRKSVVSEFNSKITAAEIAAAKSSFWAYQKPQKSAAPLDPIDPVDREPGHQSWTRGTIDQFILDAMMRAKLKPALDAEPHQILRRLHYDLIGLPPDVTQYRAFASAYQRDPENAISGVVDSLLDSPQFGERWGRHWLDVARYAESNGREVNMTFPHAWRYRDFVIDSFNDDKPYDRFLQQQIAGDLLPTDDDRQWSENLIATTFLAMGPKSLSERNRLQFDADVADEQLDTTTRVVLGTSVACARCHDHKFDPIPQSDYYALAGIFANTETFCGAPASQFGVVSGLQNRHNSNLIRLPTPDPNPFDRSYSSDEMDAMLDQVRQLREQLVESRRATQQNSGGNQTSQDAIRNLVRTQTQMETLSGSLGSVDALGQPISFCMGVQDRYRVKDIQILIRGEIDTPGPIAPRDFPQVLRDEPAVIKPNSSGRLELAKWLTSRDNPLTARVMVNRIWQHLLGTGIVRTTDDFGFMGQPPTHPELLDYLAVQFMDSGWSIKSMVREITTSRVYRLSSAAEPDRIAADPDNHWLSRGNLRRQSAEAIRDSMLALSGELVFERPRASEVAKAGYMQVRDGNLLNIGQITMSAGDAMSRRESARPLMRPQFGMGFGLGMGGMDARPGLRSAPVTSNRVDMVEANFRSVYLPILRDELPRSMEVFDFAEPSMVIGSRETSNTPNQALYMLNNELVLRLSDAFARRVRDRTGSIDHSIDEAFLLAYGRPPTANEQSAVKAFATQFAGEFSLREPTMQTLSAICQSLFASAEFRYIH